MFIKIIPITKHIELGEKKKFTTIALNSEEKTYIISVDNFAIFNLYVNFFWQNQIETLISANIFATILNKYINFPDIFISYLTTQVSKYEKIKNYVINPINNQQSLYRLIYSLKFIK